MIGSGVNTIGISDWTSIYDLYLAPWLVRETGEVKAASGDFTLQKFLDTELKVQGQFDTYPNLVESLVRNPALLDRLEELTENSVSVIGLNLVIYFCELKIIIFFFF